MIHSIRHVRLLSICDPNLWARLLVESTCGTAFLALILLSSPGICQETYNTNAVNRSQEVMLLEGNRIVRGQIIQDGNTYHVKQSAGTLVISKDNVRFRGPDLRSAYVHLQDELGSESTAENHVDLARWCLGYQLLSEARMELQAALELDPRREDVRRNLVKLDAVINAQGSSHSTIQKTPPTGSATDRLERMAGKALDGTESLGGLSREAGQQFTRKIQPILMHGCTASACHGPSSDSALKFTLVRPNDKSLRSTTEKNLLALMPYLDFNSPRSSPLWNILKDNHGAKGRTIFPGTRGQEQLVTFQMWLLSLSETSPDPAEISNSPKWQSSIVQTSHGDSETSDKKFQKGDRRTNEGNRTVKTELSTTESSPRSGGARSSSAPPMSSGRRTNSIQVLNPVLKEPKSPMSEEGASIAETDPIATETSADDEVPQRDPFDPEEFNRKQRLKKVQPLLD